MKKEVKVKGRHYTKRLIAEQVEFPILIEVFKHTAFTHKAPAVKQYAFEMVATLEAAMQLGGK